MTFVNDKFKFNAVNFDISPLINNTYDIYNIYNYIENQYIIVSRHTICFVDIEKNTVKEFFNVDGKDFSALDIYFSEDNYYVFTPGNDLTIKKIDTNFNLIRKNKYLLKILVISACKSYNIFELTDWRFYYDQNTCFFCS